MAVRPDTVGMVVQDMGKALAFYRLLGLEIPEGQDDEMHVEVQAAPGFTIGFDTEAMVRQLDPQWQSPSAGQRLNLQLRYDTSPEVDAAHSRAVIAGYTSYQDPWDAFWGQRFARLVDPDGQVVNLFAPLEGDGDPASAQG